MCCVYVQIRVIIERLVRRCGVEPVAAACPAGDVKLMTHIRKQQARKERRRGGSEAGSQVGAGVGRVVPNDQQVQLFFNMLLRGSSRRGRSRRPTLAGSHTANTRLCLACHHSTAACTLPLWKLASRRFNIYIEY